MTLDDALAASLTSLRTRFFPPERNFLDAHLTLFHALPSEHLGEIEKRLATVADRHAPMTARTRGLIDFGGGAAFEMEVAGLAALHAALRDAWAPWLTGQDDRKLRPHVTIQNKVDRATALQTKAILRELPQFSGRATGLSLWHYRGGPWDAAGSFPFRAEGG